MSKKTIIICSVLFFSAITFSFMLVANQDDAPKWVTQKMDEQYFGFPKFKEFNTLTSEDKKFYIFYSTAEDGLDPVFDEADKYICSKGGRGNSGDGKTACPKFDQDNDIIF